MGLLDGKVALVTGAGHGIGRGHALELARQGAKVVVNDLGGSVRGEGTGRAADDTVALVEKEGGTAVANYADVSKFDQAGELVQQAIDTFGTIDIVINNAGIVRDAAIWNMPESDFDAVMGVHVKGTWNVSHHAAKYWREKSKAGGPVNGRIINTTSGAGLGGNFGQTSYATAKAAIVGLTPTLAIELYKMGVTVNAIGPAGLTRITASIPGAGDAFEPDALALTSSTRWTRPAAPRSPPGLPAMTPTTSPVRSSVASMTASSGCRAGPSARPSTPATSGGRQPSCRGSWRWTCSRRARQA